jgi:hypothetical protein
MQHGEFTLPTILAGSSSAAAGTNDYNVASNLGTTYLFWVETLATDMDIKTDGTDKFYGAVFTGIDSEETGETLLSLINKFVSSFGSSRLRRKIMGYPVDIKTANITNSCNYYNL